MIPEEHLMIAFKEDELFLENLIQGIQKGGRKFSQKQAALYESVPELEHWLLRSGISPECGLAQNRIGFYADFT